jgi:hypothetical protein
MPLAYLTGSAVQGGADAFVEAEIATALSGISNVSYRVREILFELNPLALSGAADVIEMAIARRTKAAMPLITDRDVLVKVSAGLNLTTSGSTIYPGVHRLTFTEDDDLRVVEDPLFLLLDSASTALTSTLYARIGYERVNISAIDRLTLLTQSLEA